MAKVDAWLAFSGIFWVPSGLSGERAGHSVSDETAVAVSVVDEVVSVVVVVVLVVVVASGATTPSSSSVVVVVMIVVTRVVVVVG